MNYYVYAYLDPRYPGEYTYEDIKFDYLPFYIGKGSFDRDRSHLSYVKNCLKNGKPVKNCKKNNIIRQIITSCKMPIIIRIFNDIDYEWELGETKRSDVDMRLSVSGSNHGWFVDRKKSSRKNPHEYTKFTIFWDPKI